jgi:uncharacterized membrane protein YqiK
MKGKHFFIIIGQLLIILFLAVFAFVQNVKAQESMRQADAARMEAEKQRTAAEQARAEAEQQRLFAEQARAEAERQRAIAEEVMKRKR